MELADRPDDRWQAAGCHAAIVARSQWAATAAKDAFVTSTLAWRDGTSPHRSQSGTVYPDRAMTDAPGRRPEDAWLAGARVWGPSSRFDGQRVGRDHEVCDGDVVEILR